MTNPIPEKEIELDGILAAYGFLIQTAFSVICELHPKGRHGTFQIIENSILDMIKRSTANQKTNNRDVQVSVESERQLKRFLASLSLRIHS
jgi:hypothetical protein